MNIIETKNKCSLLYKQKIDTKNETIIKDN
jgi:hypothetical protein